MKKALVVLAALPVLAMTVVSAAPTHTATHATKLHGLGYIPTPLGANVPHATTNTITPNAVPTSYVITTALPPVGDQGQQGSCVAWATGYYEKSYGHGGLAPYTTSNEYSPSFIYNSLNGGVDGGLMPSDAYNFLVTNGDTSLAMMPYNQYDYTTQPDSAQIADAANHLNVSSTNIFQGAGYGDATAQQAVKNYVYGSNGQHTLVGVALPVYPEWDNAQPNDSYVVTQPTMFESSRGGHMVTIVGYDDNKSSSDGLGAFKVINQWGTSWGNAGYTWISYAFFQNYVSEAWVMETGTN